MLSDINKFRKYILFEKGNNQNINNCEELVWRVDLEVKKWSDSVDI